MDLLTKRCPSCNAIIRCRETCCEACVTRARARAEAAGFASELQRQLAANRALHEPPKAPRKSGAALNAQLDPIKPAEERRTLSHAPQGARQDALTGRAILDPIKPPEERQGWMAEERMRRELDAHQRRHSEHVTELVQRDMEAVRRRQARELAARERTAQLVDELAGVNWDNYSRQPHGE
jgi:hypothetical protein